MSSCVILPLLLLYFLSFFFFFFQAEDGIRDLTVTGVQTCALPISSFTAADVVQIDEPYMQARPEKARQYGLQALNRALDGVIGTTCVHICFGYAAIIHERPSGYSFLPELAGCRCNQVSIETAQSKLDCSVLRDLPGKQILLGTIDLSDMNVETPETVAARIRRALPFTPPDNIIVSTDCGMKYLPRAVADAKLRALVQGAAIVRAELARA